MNDVGVNMGEKMEGVPLSDMPMSADLMRSLGFESLPSYIGPDDEREWRHKEANVVVHGYPASIGDLLSRVWCGGFSEAVFQVEKLRSVPERERVIWCDE